MNLKTKFVGGLVLVLLVTTLCVAGVILREMYVDTVEQTEINLRNQVDMLAGESAVWYSGVKNAGSTLAANPALVRGTFDEVQSLLSYLQQKTPGFESVFLLNAAGKLTHIYPFNQQLMGVDFTDRAYFKEIAAGKDFVSSSVIKSRNTGASIFILAYPIKGADGRMQGMLGLTVDIKAVQDRVKNVKIGETGYAALFGADMKLIAHKDAKLVDEGKTVPEGPQNLARQNSKAVIKYLSMTGTQTIATVSAIPGAGWYLGLVVPESETFGSFYDSLKQAGAIMFIALALSIGLSWWLFGRMFRPLAIMTENAVQFGKGDFSSAIQHESSDEVGRVSDALNQMREGLRVMIRQVSHSAEQLAASSEELTAGAQQSADASGNIAASIQQVARGSEKQVGAVNETSAIVQEISATMEEVSATASEMAVMSGQTAKAAVEGKLSVDRAVAQMGEVSVGAKQAQVAAEELKTSSAQIGEIVGLISTIAGQTNLLALNAAIEAARAGEQGRGFAVVAEEVRKLAEQSEHAAHQIKTLVGSNHNSINNVVGAIDTSISKIYQGVELVNVAGANFGAISGQIGQVTEQVNNIAKAISEAAVGSQRIVNFIKEVEQLSRNAAAETQNVSAATEEQSAAMEEIAASSQALAKLAQELQTAVSKFRI